MAAVSATLEESSARAPVAQGTDRPAPPWVFWMLVLYLVLEYARPPVVVQLKLQMLIVLLLPVAWLWLGNRRLDRVLVLQLAFLFWCAKSIPLASNYYAVYFVSRTLFGSMAVALALSWVGAERKHLRQLIWIWLSIIVYQALYAVTHSGVGTGGFLGDENDLALACNTAFAFALAGFFSLKGWVRWAAGLVGAIFVAGVAASFSRGGFVGLAAMSGYLWWISPHRIRNFGIGLIVVLGLLAVAPPSYLEEIRSIGDTKQGTALGRRFLWQSAWNMWVANPVSGVGGGNVGFLMGTYQPRDSTFEGREYRERDWSGTTVHSMIFELLAEQGLVGVLLFGAIIWLHLRDVRRMRLRVRRAKGVPLEVKRESDFLGIGLMASLVGYLATGAFISVLYYPYFWYFTGLGVGYRMAMEAELARAEDLGSGAPPA